MQRILFWAGLSVFLILLVYFIIPVHIYKSMLYLIAIVGPIAIAISLISLYLLTVAYVREDGGKKENGTESYIIIAIFMICLFGGGILAISHETHLEHKELEENGVFTYAKIVDGSSFSTRKIDLSNVEVIFNQENGQKGSINISIPKSLFQHLYLNQEIPIVYSRNHLSINRVITTPEELQHYTSKNPYSKRQL
jgi:hypothetical protein